MDNTRQQIVDSINANTNILVTVSTDPTVDELSAALGLSILLNNLDKRASAVFSGKIPAAINFLEPNKTFEDTADSLRDFIIALDKEKADHLRYKVDGDVVKIFITPYRTTLSQKDLDFSQGDYNVELVIAIGVKDQDHLDKALAAHGKILHDATVVTVTAGADASSLGSIDWHDQMASSLGEMMVSLADGLKTDKPLLDEQIATAFLTGIVSATDRFSNDRTSSRVMTMAAQLMAAGANQQLIAAKLAEAHDIGPGPVAGKQSSSTDDAPAEKTEQSPKKPQNSNELSIDRQSKKSKKPKQKADAASEATALAEPALDNPTADVVPGEKELEAQIAASAAPPVAQSMADIEQALQDATDQLGDESSPKPETTSQDAVADETTTASTDENTETTPAPEPTQDPVQTPFSPAPPQPGLSFEPVQQPEQTQPIATPETTPAPEPELPPLPPLPDFGQPEQVAPQAQEPSMIINDHGSFSAQPPSTSQPLNSFTGGPAADEAPIDPFAAPVNQTSPDVVDAQPTQQTTAFEPVPAPTVPIDSPQFGTPEGAAQLGAMPATTPVDSSASGQAQSPEIPSLPPLPPLPPLPTDGSLPPLPPPPTAPDFSQPANSLSGAVSGDIFGDASAAPAAEPTSLAPEPGQYRIPGQN